MKPRSALRFREGTAVVLAPTMQAFTYVVVVALALGLLGLLAAYALKKAPDIKPPEGGHPHVPVG